MTTERLTAEERQELRELAPYAATKPWFIELALKAADTVAALEQERTEQLRHIKDLLEENGRLQKERGALEQERDAWQHLSTLQDDLLASYRVGKLRSKRLIDKLTAARERVIELRHKAGIE